MLDVPQIDLSEVKFSGRSRLYVGHLTDDVTEQELQNLFSPFGETSGIFINTEKNFAFVRLVSFFLFL